MMTYLNQLKKVAADHNVRLVRIMVDDEGNMAAVDKQGADAIGHRAP